MTTVHKILQQSVRIRDTRELNKIVLVFDQALYAKATEIQWKHRDLFHNIILWKGAFHTICNVLSSLGKHFQDADLRNIMTDSGVVSESSEVAVLHVEGRHYKRAVRVHK